MGEASTRLHCWEGGPDAWDDDGNLAVGSTCLLPLNHSGGHAFTPDDEIVIEFREARHG